MKYNDLVIINTYSFNKCVVITPHIKTIAKYSYISKNLPCSQYKSYLAKICDKFYKMKIKTKLKLFWEIMD